MKVSFLVTYYNQKEYVKQSMDSILAIDKPCEWEILVGDDGSTDGTIDEINKYVKQYPDNIKLYIMPREVDMNYDSVKRASANRLNVLQHSTGDIYCTLDGDDYFCDTEFIKEAIEVFNGNGNISVVAFGFKYFGDVECEKEITLPTYVNNKQVDKSYYLKKLYLPAGGCVHKKCFDDNRIEYIKRLGYFDDNNIVINSLNYGEMFSINRPIYAYRQTGQSVYTSMNAFEQTVLNVQGMDIDLRLVDITLEEFIKQRYSSSLITMYVWRKKIKDILGNDKCKKYIEGCKHLESSYCLDIITYDNLDPRRKKEIRRILYLKKIYTFKEFLKYLKEEVVK